MKINSRHAVIIILLSSLLPIITSGVTIIYGPDHPTNFSIDPPESHERMSDNVLLIILDGLPAYVMDDSQYMPTLSNWTDHGAKLNVTTSEITLTGACTKEMSTGRHSTPVDAMRNWEVKYEGDDDAWHYAADEGMSVAFTGFYVWKNLFPDSRFIHETVYDSGFSDVYDADDEIIGIVNRWVEQDEHDLMIAHLGGTDHAGHIYGVRSAEYIAKMNHLDAQLEDIRASAPENWTVMITADHGMSENGGHAISTGELAMNVNLLMTGAGVERGATGDIVQRDMASVPLVLLDLPFPISADSRIPLDVFDLTTSQKNELENWNWEAQVERQKWLEENGQPHADVSTDKIEWELLPETTQTPTAMDMIVSFIPLLIIGFVAFNIRRENKWKSKNMTPVLALTLTYAAAIWIHYVFYYDLSSIGLSGKWFRKSSGAVSPAFCLLMIYWYLFVVRRKDEPRSWNLPWWTPYLVMAVAIWQPDGRMSPALISLGIVAIPFSKIKKDNGKTSKLHTWTVMIIVMSTLWSVVNYTPKVLFGETLQTITEIDFLYKIWQQIIYLFMVENISWALGIIIAGSYLAHKLKESDNKNWILLAAPFSLIALLSWFGNSWTDRIVILGLLYCCWQMIVNRRYSIYAKKSPFEAKWSELAAIGLIIPTWGAWPAMITLILIRALPRFVDDHLEWLKHPAEDKLEESCRQIALASIPWFLLCVIWTHFSLLTPLGLIEFNPSKIIVTGGFFGARTDPLIPWMGLMIALPLAVSCIIITNCWKKQGFELTPALLMVSFMFTTNIINLWLSIMRPQVLLIVGFSTIIYLFWVICLAIAQKNLTEIVRKRVPN